MATSWSVYKNDVRNPLLFVLFLWISLSNVVSCYIFWQKRHSFPFKSRSIPLCVGFLLMIQIGSMNNIALIFTSPLELYCGTEECLVYSFLRGVTLPCFAYVMLLRLARIWFNHRIQQTAIQISMYFISHKLPPGISSVAQLENNWFLAHRSWIFEKNIIKTVCLGSAFIFVFQTIVLLLYLQDPDTATLGTDSVALLFTAIMTVVGCVISRLMRFDKQDNHGIGPEIGFMLKAFVLMFICHWIIRNFVLEEQVFNRSGFFNYETVVLYQLYHYRGVYVQYNRCIAIEQDSSDKTANRNQSPPLRARTLSVKHRDIMFSTQICHENTFSGVMTSEVGFTKFLEFLCTEFAAENLVFWLYTTQVTGNISQKLLDARQQEVSRGANKNVDGLPVEVLTAQETKRMSESQISSTFDVESRTQRASSSSRITHGKTGLVTSSTVPLTTFNTNNLSNVINNTQVIRPSNSPKTEKPLLISGAQSPRSMHSEIFSNAPDISHMLEEGPVAGASFVKSAFLIYNTFIKVDSLQQVNLSNAETARISAVLKAFKKQVRISPALKNFSANSTDLSICLEHEDLFQELVDAFQDAADEILVLCKYGIFPRFKRSEGYKELCKIIEDRKRWETKLLEGMSRERAAGVFQRTTSLALASAIIRPQLDSDSVVV